MTIPDLRRGFRLGPWLIEPLRGAVTGTDGVVRHLEPKAMDALVLLAENADEVVTRGEFVDTVWQGRLISDERLTHVIADLRRVLRGEDGRADFIETVPKRGYRLAARVHAAPPTAQPSVAVATVDEPRPMTSIAVLPLKNMTGDPDQEYFADGMTEALITELSKISALRVISRQSVMQFKDSNVPTPDIASRLNVDALVEGSALPLDQRVRVTVQLIDGASDSHLWANAYDRELKDVLELHSEIARSIAQEIRIAVTPEEADRLSEVRAVEPQAYRNYLFGQHCLNSWDPEEHLSAVRYFERAIALDPHSSAAQAGLAKSYGGINFFGYLPPADYVDKWRAAAALALELDGNLANGHEACGEIGFYYDWLWTEAEKSFRRAIQLNENYAEAHQWYAWFLLAMNRVPEAHEQIRRALDVNPLAISAYLTASDVYHMSRDIDKAIAELDQVLRHSPKLSFAHSRLGWSYLQKGLFAEAISSMETAVALSPRATEHRWMLGYAYGLTGQADNAHRVLNYIEKRAARRYVHAFGLAHIHLGLGDTDRALDYLERAYEDRNPWMVYSQMWPPLDALRGTDRFQKVMRRMKFPE